MKKEVSIDEEVYSMVKPIFEKALKETLPNSMTTIPPPIKFFIRFNNYRRQIKYPVYKDSTFQKVKTTIASTHKKQINACEHTKIISIRSFKPQVTIQIFKNTITAIWFQNIRHGKKEGYVVEGKNIDQICQWVDDKKKEIEEELDAAIKEILTLLKHKDYIFNPITKRKEIEVKGEEFIDSLPKDLILYDTVFKKVYDKGVEFKDEVYVKNFIKTRALEDVTPRIAEQLTLIDRKIDLLDKRQESQAKVQEYYDKNVVKHFEVLSKMSKTLTKMSKLEKVKRQRTKIIEGRKQKSLKKWV